ncbi:MAG: DMT family transporter [Candidatus Hodarchaeota archaeon]
MNDEDTSGNLVKTKHRRVSVILLVITTVLWGTTFTITKTLTTEVMPPFFYMGLRFLIATLGFLPFMMKFKKLDIYSLKVSAFSGFLYFASNITQTLGLAYTTPSKAGFLTGINVILVPVFLAIFFKKKVKKTIWIAVILAIVGTYILSFSGIEGVSIGDPLIIACAVLYAWYIIYIDKHTRKIDPILFSTVQLIFITAFSFGVSGIFEDWGYILGSGADSIFTTNIILIMVYMGIIATSLTFLFQIFGQQHVSSSRTALIFALEPVFATIFAILWGKDVLTLQLVIGSILIFVGIIISIERNNKEENAASIKHK